MPTEVSGESTAAGAAPVDDPVTDHPCARVDPQDASLGGSGRRFASGGTQPEWWPPRARARRNIERGVAMLIAPDDTRKTFSDQRIERDYLAVVRVAAKHQVDASLRGRFEPVRPVIQQHRERVW